MLNKKSTEIGDGVFIFASDSGSQRTYQKFPVKKVFSCLVDGEESERILRLYNTWNGRRPLSNVRVNKYKERMKRGFWLYSAICLAVIVDEKGKPVLREDGTQTCYLVNGQHFLKASSLIGSRFAATFYIYETQESLLHFLYAQIDSIKVKKFKESFSGLESIYSSCFGQSNRGENKLSDTILWKIVVGVYWSDYEGFKSPFSFPEYDTFFKIIEENKDFIFWLMQMSPNPQNPFSRKLNYFWKFPVFGCIYKTWKYGDKSTVKSFWGSVLYDQNHRKGNPTQVLRDLLIDLHQNESQSFLSYRIGHLPERIVYIVSRCWNYFVDDPTQMIYLNFEEECNDWTCQSEIVFNDLEENSVSVDFVEESHVEVKVGHVDHREKL